MSTRGPGRPRETSHDEIREVALELFARNGYSATSLAQIAAAAGISRTTLFSYLPAKRDLLWEEHDARLRALEALLAADPGEGNPVDLIGQAMLVLAAYEIEDHHVLAVRKRIAEQDEELRAYAALAVQDLTQLISQAAQNRATDRELTDLVTRALIAAAAACIDDWIALDPPEESLEAYAGARLAPILAALRPLLE